MSRPRGPLSGAHALAGPAPAAGRDLPPLATRVALLAALALATIAAFAGVVRNGWIVLDDPAYVTENPHVTAGLTRGGLLWFLHAPHAGNWHPLTSWSHMLDVQWFGLNPGAHHAVSLGLHVANALLLVLVLSRLTGAWWRSLIVGTLFALHPLRVESVAWVSERKDVLSLFCFLLTIDAYRRWSAHPGGARWALVIALFALGLMSKPMLVTTPLVLLLLDLWPLRRLAGDGVSAGARPDGAPARSWAGLVLEKWPLFALSAASAAITFAVQRAEGAVVSAGASTVAHRLANAAVSYVRYVAMTLWPARLAAFYPDAPVAPAAGLASALALAAVSVLVVRAARRRPEFAVGWAWYLITLLPVIGLVQVGGQSHADRYTYLPAIGLLIALAWLPVPRRFGTLVASAVLVAAVALGIRTSRQAALWKDTTTLFSAALRVTRDNAMAHDCLGTAMVRQGNDAQARTEFEEAIRIRPDFVNPYVNLGELHHRAGHDADAARCFEVALRARPGDAALADETALALLGAGRIDDASAVYRDVLARSPDDVEALRQLAIVRASEGHADEALPLLRRAERLAPRDASVQQALAKAAYATGGSAAETVSRLRRAIALEPGWAEPYCALALVLATDPDATIRAPDEAVTLGARAVALTRERDADALTALATALHAAYRDGEAAAAARKALALADAAGTSPLSPAARAQLEAYAGHAARR